jgi:hypothetical protein
VSNNSDDDVKTTAPDRVVAEAVREDLQRDAAIAESLHQSGKATKARLTLSDVLHDVDDLLFVRQHLDASAIGGELTTARTIGDKLSRIRALLTDLILQRPSPR